MDRARPAIVLYAALALVCALVAGVALGSAAPLGWSALAALFDADTPGYAIVHGLRLPRVLSGAAVGALLGIAGALLQVLLRNPLAEPYVLGLSGGAALGALSALALSLPALLISGGAAAGALVATIGVFAAARREFTRHAPASGSERLLLSGVMFAALWGALIALVLAMAPEGRLQGMIFWLMGDLAGSGSDTPLGLITAVALGIAAVLALALAPRLNLLARGEETAALLGENVGRLKTWTTLLAAFAAGTAVAAAGPVGFIGLVAPHLVRRVAGNDQRVLLPAAAFTGAALLVMADLIARWLVAPWQLPVGAVTAVLGAPVFLFLLWRRSA